jgi:hypothetical protein
MAAPSNNGSMAMEAVELTIEMPGARIDQICEPK